MFKVGDPVWCKRRDTYSITDYHVRCRVVDVCDDMMIVVEVGNSGYGYTVPAYDFEKLVAKVV